MKQKMNTYLFGASMVALTFSLNITNVNAASTCAAMPTCAEMGYTEYSCGNGAEAIKCPFDTTKVKCIKNIADDCSSLGYNGESCDCGYAQRKDVIKCPLDKSKVVCVCSTCANGDYFYSDFSCNKYIIPGKTIVGVVIDVENGIAMALNDSSDSISWNDGTTNWHDIENVDNVATAFMTSVYSHDPFVDSIEIMDESEYCSGIHHKAAELCKNQSTFDMVWALPREDKIYVPMSWFSGKLQAAGGTGMSGTYWSSTEIDESRAFAVSVNNGYSGASYQSKNKNETAKVRCIIDMKKRYYYSY